MLPAEAAHGIEIFDMQALDQLRPLFQAQRIGWWEARRNAVKTVLRGRNDRLALLMKEGREEQELAMLGLETSSTFVNAAFAQDENLLTPREGIHHDGPLFECCRHTARG